MEEQARSGNRHRYIPPDDGLTGQRLLTVNDDGAFAAGALSAAGSVEGQSRRQEDAQQIRSVGRFDILFVGQNGDDMGHRILPGPFSFSLSGFPREFNSNPGRSIFRWLRPVPGKG